MQNNLAVKNENSEIKVRIKQEIKMKKSDENNISTIEQNTTIAELKAKKTEIEKQATKDIADIEKQIKLKMGKCRKSELKIVIAKMAEFEFTYDEIKGKVAEKSSRKTRSKMPVKYRNGELTFSGNGRPPQWIIDARKKGVDIEQYKVTESNNEQHQEVNVDGE